MPDSIPDRVSEQCPNHLVLITHSPLAQALRECALHVFPECADFVHVLGVEAQAAPEASIQAATDLIRPLAGAPFLVLTDIFGATPCNVAQKVVEGQSAKLVAGVNLPMLLRAITYRHEALELLAARAVAGGTQGVMQVAITAPQNQVKRHHDQNRNDHHQ